METNYSSKTLDHLGLLSGICFELGLVDVINDLLPRQSSDQIVSNGHAVLAMVLNGLGFVNQALYLTPAFFSDKPVDRLISPYLKAEHLNDDSLGRCLDRIYDYGCVGFYNTVVSQILKKLDVSTALSSLDMTNFSLHGTYANQSDQGVQITQGYSKAHRPDLNQVSLALISLHSSKIPILMQPLDGNAEESGSYRKIIQDHITHLKNDIGVELISIDSKGYTSENIAALSSENMVNWISRVPNSIKAVQQLYQDIDLSQMQALDDNYVYLELGSNYGGIDQRWVLIHSQTLADSKGQKIQKRMDKQLLAQTKDLKKLMRKRFNCSGDAQLALEEFKSTLRYYQLDDEQIVETKKYLKAGKPNAKTPYKMVYSIRADLKINAEYKTQKSKEAGFFVLASNQLEEKKLAAKDFLKIYKGQDATEKGFRFLKDPKVVNTSLMLKKNSRIQALLTIMTLCLFVYACLEHKIRKALKTDQTEGFFKDQKGKITKKPTARWVFFCFKGIHLLEVNKEQKIVLNLKPIQRKLLDMLGKHYWIYYS